MPLNTVLLMGNLTRDPELKYSQGKGTAYLKFTLAVNSRTERGGRMEDEVSFVEIVCFGKAAERIAETSLKGHPLSVVGRLRTETWVDSHTQKNRSKLVVMAEKVYNLLENPEPAKAPAPAAAPQQRTFDEAPPARQAPPASAPAPGAPPAPETGDNYPEDDVPF